MHLHEPGTPSLSLLALGATADLQVPVVATFHPSNTAIPGAVGGGGAAAPAAGADHAPGSRSRSTPARPRCSHVGGEPVVIPNGLYVDRFRGAEPDPALAGADATLCFVGRLDEPRKGLPGAAGRLRRCWRPVRPGLRLLVVGGGDVDEARTRLPEPVRGTR